MTDTDPFTRDAAALAEYLSAWELSWVIRALGKPKKVDEVRSYLVGLQKGRMAGGHRLTTSGKGVQVEKWPGLDPWVITWSRMFAVVRSRADPGLAEVLSRAVEANDSDAARAAAVAILCPTPPDAETADLPYCPDGAPEDHGGFISIFTEALPPTLNHEWVCETCGKPSEHAYEARNLIPINDLTTIDWISPAGKILKVTMTRERAATMPSTSGQLELFHLQVA